MQYFQYAVSFALAGAIVVLFMCEVQGKNWRSIGLFKEKAVVSYFKGAGIAFLGIVAIISFLQFKGELTISAIPINRGVHLFGIILIILLSIYSEIAFFKPLPTTITCFDFSKTFFKLEKSVK